MTSPAQTLQAQRQVTAAFIANDPTTAVLIPSARVKTASGGYVQEDGTPRIPQTFKMSLLSADIGNQGKVTTVAGVERLEEYHLIGPHDMLIEQGDYWIDSEGTKFEVMGFSHGWGYMTKAFVTRHIPREAKP